MPDIGTYQAFDNGAGCRRYEKCRCVLWNGWTGVIISGVLCADDYGPGFLRKMQRRLWR